MHGTDVCIASIKASTCIYAYQGLLRRQTQPNPTSPLTSPNGLIRVLLHPQSQASRLFYILTLRFSTHMNDLFGWDEDGGSGGTCRGVLGRACDWLEQGFGGALRDLEWIENEGRALETL